MERIGTSPSATATMSKSRAQAASMIDDLVRQVRRAGAAACVVLVVGGCDDSFQRAREQDTIEGWTAYLATKPTGTDELQAEERLDELMFESAKSSDDAAGWDRYLARFPRGRRSDDARQRRAEASFAVAMSRGTRQDWEWFIQDNPAAKADLLAQATRRVDAFRYADSFHFAGTRIDSGPSGATLTTRVTNGGDRAVEYLAVALVRPGGDIPASPTAVLLRSAAGGDGSAHPLLAGASVEVSALLVGSSSSAPLPSAALVPIEVGIPKWDRAATETAQDIDADERARAEARAAAAPSASGDVGIPATCNYCAPFMLCFTECAEDAIKAGGTDAAPCVAARCSALQECDPSCSTHFVAMWECGAKDWQGTDCRALRAWMLKKVATP